MGWVRIEEASMTRIILLSTASLLALTAGGALAGSHPGLLAKPTGLHPFRLPSGVLYNQNSNFGYGIDSQNFSGSSSSLSSAAGDDFVIPAGQKWRITEVDVTGMYFNGSGPAKSEVVTFYTNKKGRPDKAKATFTLNCTDSRGSFACALPGTGQRLSGGTFGKRYWLSVVANCDFISCGQWGWVQNTVTHNKPGQWENPQNGFGTGCTTWNNTSTCIPSPGVVDDYAFDLKGKKL
jgi:hypothetical protein